MLQNNELIKKTDSTEGASGLFVKGQRGRSKSRDPEVSNSFSCYFCKKPGHIKKNCMKYKERLKRKIAKILMGLVSVKSQIKQVVEEADEDSYDVLTAESGKSKYLDAWLLDSRCTYHMCPKRAWFNTYKLYDGGSVLMENYVVCKCGHR